MSVSTVSGFFGLELLEARRLLSASPVYDAHSIVRGESLSQYAADWWKGIFATPVFAADGVTFVNPQFDPANNEFLSANGKVIMLGGSFFGGSIARTITVPTGTPVFVPIVNDEWSNPDTSDPLNTTNVPGDWTAAQLANFAVLQSNTIFGLAASLDGTAIPDMMSHREPSLSFQYTQPANFSIDQVFFGETITGATQAAADGYYLMLKPLSPGKHVLHFVGSSPDNTQSDPPLLSAFTVDMTYTINVVPNGHFAGAPQPVSAAQPSFSSVLIADDKKLIDVLE
jgi:hypothetical protein